MPAWGFCPPRPLAWAPPRAPRRPAAPSSSRLSRRLGTALAAVAGGAATLIGTAWASRVGPDTGYLAGIALPMLVFGIGQGFGLSALTTGGMAGVAAEDAGVAGGLVNVAHHLGGALGLGILVTVFDAAGGLGDTPHVLLADRVSAALTVAVAFLALALAVTLLTRPRRGAAAQGTHDLPPDLSEAAAATPAPP